MGNGIFNKRVARMEHTLDHRIRERAYAIWHAHGQAHGQADDHWLAAEREVLSSLQARAADTSAPPKSEKRARSGSRTGHRAANSTRMPAQA